MTRKPTRKPVDTEIFGVKFTTTPLEYKIAEDNLPDVALIVSRVWDRAVQEIGPAIAKLGGSLKDLGMADVMAILPAIGPIAMVVFTELGHGVLKRLVPPIYSTTEAIITNEQGVAEKLELMKESDRALLFDEHPDTYLASLFFAGWVTYARFFPVKDLIAKAMAKAQTMSPTTVAPSSAATAAAPTTS